MNEETQHLPAERQTQLPAERPHDLLVVIASAAANPNCDVGKMQALLEMQRRIELQDAEGRFNAAFLEAQKAMPTILKKGHNPSTNSPYVKFEDVQYLIMPILAAHNFSITWGGYQSQIKDHYGIRADLTHMTVVNGKPISFSKPYNLDVPTDTLGPKGNAQKTAVQGMGSAVSYGQRYMLKMMFSLRFIGEDNDGNRPKGITPEKPAQGPATGSAKVEQYDDQANKRRVIDLTRNIHGIASGYKEAVPGSPYMQKLDQFLVDETLISDTQTWTELKGKPLADLIVKIENKLRGA